MVEAANRLVEKDSDFPEDQRQNLMDLEDTYDGLTSKPELQEASTPEQAVDEAREQIPMSSNFVDNLDESELEPAWRRTFRNWNGWIPYVIQYGDTLPSIAASQLGDASMWYEIALMNGLAAPYISENGYPKTAKVGDEIMIPANTTSATPMATPNNKPTPKALFGTDMKLRETDGSRPGRPMVDLMIDPSSGTDVATIGGVENLVQACQMRLWVERETLLLDKSYGLPAVTGYPSSQATIQAIRHAGEGGLQGDSRIQSVQSMTVLAENDMINVEATVLPVGLSTSVDVGISLV